MRYNYIPNPIDVGMLKRRRAAINKYGRPVKIETIEEWQEKSPENVIQILDPVQYDDFSQVYFVPQFKQF